MTPNQINFEKLLFNPFYNKKFFDAECERDPDEISFNELNTQNLEFSYLFPIEIERFISEKKISETMNAVHVNIRSLSKYFDNLRYFKRE